MTILERVKDVLTSEFPMDEDAPATVEKMILLAYYIGREEAARQVSDMYAAHIREQRERADQCRYRHMAQAVVGPENYLYSPDYAQEMTETFGSDPADI